jgi:hypothetical protein
MVDNMADIDVRERFERHAVTLLFQVDPRSQRLFHDPATGPFEARRHRLDPLSKVEWDVRGQDLGVSHSSLAIKVIKF